MSNAAKETRKATSITIHVLGTPGSKGSGRAVLSHGRALYLSGGSGAQAAKLKAWDGAVRDAARRFAAASGWPPGPRFVGVPLRIELVFAMRRPGGHYGKLGLKPSAPEWPAVTPDLDKLVRATLDPLTGIVFDDDSRIVALEAQKVYADNSPEGATVVVSQWGWP